MDAKSHKKPFLIFLVVMAAAALSSLGSKVIEKYTYKNNKTLVVSTLKEWKQSYPKKPQRTNDLYSQKLNLFETDISDLTKKLIVITNGPDKEFGTEDDYCESVEVSLPSKHKETVIVEKTEKVEDPAEEKSLLQKISLTYP